MQEEMSQCEETMFKSEVGIRHITGSKKVSLLISIGERVTIDEDLLVEAIIDLLEDLSRSDESSPEDHCEVEVTILEEQDLAHLLAHTLEAKPEDI